jgi:hypothetical protein
MELLTRVKKELGGGPHAMGHRDLHEIRRCGLVRARRAVCSP